MNDEQKALIDMLEIAVQESAARAGTILDGEQIGIIELLKRLSTAYGVETDAMAQKSRGARALADSLERFARQTFKTPEQRAAEAQAIVDAKRAADEEFLRQYAYDKEIGVDVTDRELRAKAIAEAIRQEISLAKEDASATDEPSADKPSADEPSTPE